MCTWSCDTMMTSGVEACPRDEGEEVVITTDEGEGKGGFGDRYFGFGGGTGRVLEGRCMGGKGTKMAG